jgi:hypothetical protein
MPLPMQVPEQPAPIAIGAPVWVFDENRRVYEHDGSGRPVGSPLRREHWRPWVVVGETRASWIIGPPGSNTSQSWATRKVPKKGPWHDIAWSLSDVNADVWAHEHRWRIEHMVQRCSPDVLRRVADLVGYVEKDAAT